MKSGTFDLVDVDGIYNGRRVFGSKCIDTVMASNNDIKYMRRLVAQNCGDKDLATIVNKSPTVQKFSQRLVQSLAAYLEDRSCHKCDITQAYTQSVPSLEREVYNRPPIESGLPKQKVLKLVEPL